MARRNIQVYSEAGFGWPGSKKANVAAAATAILSGEPVSRAPGATTVTAAATNFPVVGTDYCPGIACSDSTQTATAAGSVQVCPLNPASSWLIAPKVPASWDTQAKYNALVGKRVLLDLTAGVYTILATDGATNGCVVEPMNISEYPGLVRFSFRQEVDPLN